MGTKRALDELMYAFYAQSLPAAFLDGTAEYTAGGGVAAGNTFGNSVGVVGTVTAPGANAAITTLSAPVAGLYQIDTVAGYGANPETVTDFNMNLRAGATAISQLLVFGANSSRSATFYRRLDGSTALTINAIAAGSAGSVYVAQIIATKIAD